MAVRYTKVLIRYGFTGAERSGFSSNRRLHSTVLSHTKIRKSVCRETLQTSRTVHMEASIVTSKQVDEERGNKNGHFTNPESSKDTKELRRHVTHARKSILYPPINQGMTVLNKSAFDKTIAIPVIKVYEDQMQPAILRDIKPVLLKIPGIKPIQDNEFLAPGEIQSSRKTKKIFLNPDVLKDKDLMKFVEEFKLDPQAIADVRFENHKLTYDNWTWSQILDSVLPDEHDKLSSFSHIGHVLHLNLRDHLLPYKQLIGQVFLDKISRVSTVVNKLNNIDTTYRNFAMEVIAGNEDTVVKVKENRCEYEFDFKHVYWNPRLSAEHERVVKLLNSGDVLYDVFAGVGPFAIPAAKKGVTVLANDLNPESFRWLQFNVKKNKVQGMVQCFQQDGRPFIQENLPADLKRRLTVQKDSSSFKFSNKFHVVMNLPAIAVEFLDAFWGILDVHKTLLTKDFNVIVHVYCFIKDIEGFKDKALKLVESHLSYTLSKESVLDIVQVRNVAPNKEMLRVSFLLPHDVMFSLKRKHSKSEG